MNFNDLISAFLFHKVGFWELLPNISHLILYHAFIIDLDSAKVSLPM